MQEVLTQAEREKIDTRPDGTFYQQPRFVEHVDAGFRRRLTGLYAEQLDPGDRVLDAMSSHVSHLPEIGFDEVIGHGMNTAELKANDRLDRWFVQDLNREHELPLPDGSVDAVLCAVSVQYLQYPGAVFTEFSRVLTPGGVVIVSFSNRMFPTKAIRAWREAGMTGRLDLVRSYITATGGFDPPTAVRDTPGGDPFYAVYARRRG